MDPLMAMMSTEELEEEKLRAMAAQLRGGSSTGARLSTSSLEPVQAQGRLMQNQANQRAQQIGLMQARGEANRARAASDAARAAQLDKATRFSKFSNSFTDRIKESARTQEETLALIGRFGGNEFAGEIPLMGKAENWMVSKFPGAFDENAKRSASWWKDWNMFYNNPTRNKLFGSALTAPEQRAWDAANIHPDMNDEEISLALGTLKDVLKKRALTDVETIRAQGMPEEWSTAVFSRILSEDEFYNPGQFSGLLQEKLSDPDYRLGEREGAGGQGGSSIQDLSDEELIELYRGL